MTVLELHLVGGFLGSGKTTAIINAAKVLMRQGLRVGVVTNDQGKYLVDTAFVRLEDIPAVEVSGGCFCCHYDDLETSLAQLQGEAAPDVVFAESVGSCADVVATVVKPLLALRGAEWSPRSFSVFADARLLWRWLQEQPLPFSENVVYLFGKQLEEAGLVVINKRDLLAEAEAREVLALTQARFPGKPVRLQNSLDQADVAEWVALLQSRALPGEVLEIDYARYGAGEADLAWLDEVVTLTVPPNQGRAAAQQLLSGIATALREARLPVGHVKFVVRAGEQAAKVSLTALDEEDASWQPALPALPGQQVEVLVNARVAAPAEALRDLVAAAVARVDAGAGVTATVAEEAYFHPGFPRPTHRME